MISKTLAAPVLALFFSVLFTFSISGQDTGAAVKSPVLGHDGIWTSVEVKDLQVLIPGKPANVQDEATAEIRSIHAMTEVGNFGVVVKGLGKQVDARNTESMVDSVAIAALTAKTKLIEKHDVEYEGTRGEQVTYLEDGNRMFARIFLLNDRLIVMSVSFKEQEYYPELDTVVSKFFDSIRVNVPLLVA